MVAAITHQDVPIDAIRAALTGDIVLGAMTVAERALQGVYLLAVPQEESGAGPSIVIGPPITHDLSQRKHPNGPNLIAADFITDVMIHIRDVEVDDAGLRAMRKQIIGLLEGRRIAVDGGEAFTITIYDYPSPQRVDNGTYIFSAIGVIFLVAAQVD